ncbi:MAG: hypothetical protein IKO47_02275 [Ruminococcus sp.]|nr:hypothetical protein [Ruminococcus sp.]
MKKYLAFVSAFVLVCSAAAGCGKDKSSSDSDALKPAAFDTTEDASGQPDPLASTEADTAAEQTTEALETTSAPEATEEQTTEHIREVDPLGGGAFSYDKNGAIVFKDYKDADDRTLMAAAEKLFESACDTEWKFKFSMPFTIDQDDYVENEYSWRYYLITTPGINSFSDVVNEYHKVFSDRYPDQLSDNYIDHNGRAYGFTGGRGSNIFYSASKIVAIESRTDDEIFFTVENYYDGTDLDGSAPRTEKDVFSCVISPDGTWRAGKFTLPN